MNRQTTFVLTLLILTPVANLSGAEFLRLGPDLNLLPNAVSANGRIVVGSVFDGVFEREAFIWSRENGLQKLGVLPGHSRSDARDISADGSVIVGWSGPDTQLFVWTEDDGMMGLEIVPEFPITGGFPRISEDGSTISSTVVSVGDPLGHDRAIRWTDNTGFMILLPDGTTDSRSHAASADGRVVAIEAKGLDDSWGGFTWDEQNGFQSLGPKPRDFDNVAPALMSADGSVIFGDDSVGSGGGKLFRWTAETGIQTLPLLPTAQTGGWLEDLTPDGSSAVGAMVDGRTQQYQAVLWDEQNETRDLRDVLLSEHGFAEQDLPALHWARGISADATMVLGYNNPFSDAREAWAIYLDKPLVSVPEPSASLLLLIGGSGVLLRRRVRVV